MNYWKKMDINKIVENIKNYDYASIDVETFLDERDSNEFEEQWLNIYNQIDDKYIPEEVKKTASELRKEVFLFIDRTVGISELSDYISDDIELILYADYLKIHDVWFDRFVEKYENGGFLQGSYKNQNTNSFSVMLY